MTPEQLLAQQLEKKGAGMNALGGFQPKRSVGTPQDFGKAMLAGTTGASGDILELAEMLGISPKGFPNPFMTTEDFKGKLGAKPGLASMLGEMASPLPTEGLTMAKGLGNMLAAIGPMFWKGLKGNDRKVVEEIFQNDFTRRRFLQEVPGTEYKYGTIQIPEESMPAAKHFAEQRGLSFTNDMTRFEQPGQIGTRSPTRKVDDPKTSSRFTTKGHASGDYPKSTDGKFRIVEFTATGDEAAKGGVGRAVRQNPEGLGRKELVINADEASRPGMTRREFEVPEDRTYNMDTDPDGLWEQTYRGAKQSLHDRKEEYKRLVSERYDAGYSVDANNEARALMFRHADEIPQAPITVGNKTATPTGKSAEWGVQSYGSDVPPHLSETLIRADSDGYMLYRKTPKGVERYNINPLDSFMASRGDNVWSMKGTNFNIVEEGDVWVINQVSKSTKSQTLRSADPIEAFRDLLFYSDAGGMTVVFDDPAKSMLAFENSSYVWGGRKTKDLAASDMTFQIGGGWKKLLKEQFNFTEVNGMWVRLPQGKPIGFNSVDEALHWLK